MKTFVIVAALLSNVQGIKVNLQTLATAGGIGESYMDNYYKEMKNYNFNFEKINKFKGSSHGHTKK